MGSRKYTENHEWTLINDDVATIGISQYAQDQLGDVVYVELPEVGLVCEALGQVAVVESVKAASEIYSPISGEIIEVNQRLEDEPELVNSDPLGNGWIFKIKPSDLSQLDKLESEQDYLAKFSAS